MNPHLLIVTIGLCYTVVFGGLTLLRREGLSAQFAFEVLGITGLVEAGALLTGSTVNPLLFLVLIYLLSMRGRLLVDLANILSNRGRQKNAISLLQFALRLFPDRTTRLIIMVNMGIVQLRRQSPASAQALLEAVLQEAEAGGLGVKYEAASQYNLGLALQRQGKQADAVRHFNEAVGIFPGSIYGKAAQRALEQRRQRTSKPAKSVQDMEADAPQPHGRSGS
jgi:tetratricopeptide (TPR) repeat protein